MTFGDLARRGLTYYWRSHVAVVGGVATAVAVLAGSLLVGASVRHSLEAITLSRLGRTAQVITAESPFTVSLADRIAATMRRGAGHDGGRTTALLTLSAAVTHPGSDRRAHGVTVYGVDDRFFAFHGLPVTPMARSDVWVSPRLTDELGATPGDPLVVRVERPTDIPLDSLHGRRDQATRSMRLRVAGTLASERGGEFSVAPGQAPVRAVFMSLSRLQQDIDQPGRANMVLVDGTGVADGTPLTTALRASVGSADLDVRIREVGQQEGRQWAVESGAGLLPDVVSDAAGRAADQAGLHATPVLTWLANRLIVGDRVIPYSLVTAIGHDAGGDDDLARALRTEHGDARAAPLVLNDWAASDLRADVGDAIELEFYRYTDAGALTTARARFRVADVVPMRGLAADRNLAPDYPGISDSRSVADWDPPFPIDLRLIRPADDEYWARYRTTPKAFITIESGQRLWAGRHGRVTSLRLRPRAPASPSPEQILALPSAIAAGADALRAGFNVIDVRRQNVSASRGATDFGAYFSYFSFFLMASALLLTAMFFRLGIEQRLSHVGLLRAVGFSLQNVRRMFMLEAVPLTVAGAILGVALAVVWAWLMMLGLRTWWVGAVGTTALQLHVAPGALLGGAACAVVAAMLSIALAVQALRRRSPRELLTGAFQVSAGNTRAAAAVTGGAALLMTVVLAAGRGGAIPAAAAFFGAAALSLVVTLGALRLWLARPHPLGRAPVGPLALLRLGAANAAWRPARSITCAALVASAVFLLVAVDAFRKRSTPESIHTGTGGFALFAESSAPVVDDPSTASGRVTLGLQDALDDPRWREVSVVPARLRPGDDAGCLNLYRPSRPRLLGVRSDLLASSAFRFAAVADQAPAGASPWHALGPADASGIVPAIADATSLQYALHASVGDVITVDADAARPLRLRIVAALADSMLQSEIVIADEAFTALFPDRAGYRVFLVAAPGDDAARLDELTSTLERRLETVGLDVGTSAARLDSFHQVENTYISTFQMLGGLGLVLGTIGLAAVTARSVVERRRELALLAASGYTPRHLQTLIASEQIALVSAGIVGGVAASVLALVPVFTSSSVGWPRLPLLWLAAVFVVGVFSAAVATRAVRRLPLLGSLRGD